MNDLDKLAAMATELEGHQDPSDHLPQTAILMGQAMTQACEKAALEVEKAALAAQDAASETMNKAVMLAKAIREHGVEMNKSIDDLVVRLRDMSDDMERRRDDISRFYRPEV